MSTVKFAELCDVCGRRSEEYTTWPHCRECLRDICQTCAVPGSVREQDRDTLDPIAQVARALHLETVLCRPCAAAESEAA